MKSLTISLVICGVLLNTQVFAGNQSPCHTFENRYEFCIKSGVLESVSDVKRQPSAPYGEDGDTLMSYLDQNLQLNENISSISPNAFKNMDTMMLNISTARDSIKLVPESLAGLTKVRILDIKSPIDPMKKNLFRELRSLRTLSISFDGSKFKLEDALVGLKKLKDLSLDQSNLTNINPETFASFNRLTSLNLQFNQLTNIKDGSFHGIHQLQHLSLKGNQLNFIGRSFFRGFMNMTTLNLAKNRIKTIEKGAFSGMNIGSLRLEFNALTEIQAGTFRGLRAAVLNLSENKNIKIDDGAFDGSTIEKIFLPGYLDTSQRDVWKLPKSTEIVLTDK